MDSPFVCLFNSTCPTRLNIFTCLSLYALYYSISNRYTTSTPSLGNDITFTCCSRVSGKSRSFSCLPFHGHRNPLSRRRNDSHAPSLSRTRTRKSLRHSLKFCTRLTFGVTRRKIHRRFAGRWRACQRNKRTTDNLTLSSFANIHPPEQTSL